MEEKEKSLNHEISKNEEFLSGDQRIARLGDRLIALIIDTLLMASILAVIGMWSARKWGGITEAGFDIKGFPAMFSIMITVLLGFLYFWILEGIWGITLGKVIIGIQVIKKDGTHCHMRASLIRNLLRFVDGLGVYLVGFLIAIFSRMRQRLGDHLADTIVIERKFHTLLRVVLVILWLGGIGGGIFLSYDLHRGTLRPIATPSPAPTPSVTPSVNVPGDLKIINFKFVQSKDGPIRPEAPYKPGDKVYIDYSVAGYTTDKEGKVYVTSTATILDPSGLLLYPPLKRELHEVVPKMEKPVELYFNYYFDLPYYAPSGKFNIQIKVHDSVKNTEAELIQPFDVEEGATETSTRLEIKDFQFSLSEEGPPVTKPAIQPGGTIYSSCKVFGIKFRDDRPEVQISLKVIGPKGEIIIEKQELISINKACFYRPATFFERISAWVTLPSKAPKGRYIWKYTITDKIGNAKVDYDANFEVM
jgi:uncharacterized RDD family membrane protein YckC